MLKTKTPPFKWSFFMVGNQRDFNYKRKICKKETNVNNLICYWCSR